MMRFGGGVLAATILAAGVAHGTTLALEVVLNNNPTGTVATVEQDATGLHVNTKELETLGLIIPNPGNKDEIELTQIPGLSLRIDERRQELYIDAPTRFLRPERLNASIPSDASTKAQSGLGIMADYDLLGTDSRLSSAVDGLFDVRAFSPWGVASTTFLGSAGTPGLGRSVRLDTGFVFSDVDQLRRYSLGDTISGGLAWTRPVRLAGVQVQSDFALQPWLVTFPTPTLRGTVAVPSTVDLLVNGTRTFSQQVQPGPFQIDGAPVIAGQNGIAIRVTDALGRQTELQTQFYAGGNLLAQGLESYSLEVGAIRLGYGLESNSYGEVAAIGTWRGGISDRLTAEAHAEGAGGLGLVGGGATIRVGDLGEVELNAAVSEAFAGTGALAHIGVRRLGSHLNLGLDLTLASRDYSDVAGLEGDSTARRQLTLNAGYGFGRAGTVQVSLVDLVRDPLTNGVDSQAFTQASLSGLARAADRARLISGSYSVQLKRVAIYVTGYNDFENRRSYGAMAGLTLSVGRTSVAGNAGDFAGKASSEIEAVRPTFNVGDVGYQMYASAAPGFHGFAQGSYSSPWGLLSAGVDDADGVTTGRLEARGSISLIDGRLFAANYIENAFAVIDTDGYPGVKVYDDNRLIGTTGPSGKLIAADLRAYDVNRLSLDPNDIPPDANLPSDKLLIRPRDRSGVVAKFNLSPSRGAIVRLVDPAGKPIPLGSVARLIGADKPVAVGYDGEAYVTSLGPRDRVEVTRSDGARCAVTFSYNPDPGGLPTLGPFTCAPI